jgi:hypothetical protein
MIECKTSINQVKIPVEIAISRKDQAEKKY